jgi:hypothetical protein
MPTENEKKVLNLLSATDLVGVGDPGALIESWGNEAVTVACEIAMGSFPGLAKKVRTNAVAVLETVKKPQAMETISLLIKDPDSDIAIRAARAAAGQNNTEAISNMGTMLQRPTLVPLVAVELVKSLIKLDTADAKSVLSTYEQADATKLPHRANNLVRTYLLRAKEQK